jgi:hypothetical protein
MSTIEERARVRRASYIRRAVAQARAFNHTMVRRRHAGDVRGALLARERRDIWLDAARRAKAGVSL